MTGLLLEPDSHSERGGRSGQPNYTVVARRYRPQSFTELVGQEFVSQALSGAIRADRVGHAYLFTGARGVGKTSTARIFAKSLNCVRGPTTSPCGECDICQSIAAGADLDVLEIDGASNRGIDEIRQLRQNVSVRPGRSRYKIYIIDEVHMLTREAFNALLKTLEEPPPHVKFIFCTTEAAKIPITILSRCQRFDFVSIPASDILGRLRQICDLEQADVDDEALRVLARRAAGSMRDSQSLLEQVLSLGLTKITAADVHALLGTVADAYLDQLLRAVLTANPAACLEQLSAALGQGVDPGQLIEQLMASFRDLLACAAGCPVSACLFLPEASRDWAPAAAQAQGVDWAIAAMQVLETAVGKLRYSTQPRLIVELALVRLCRLHLLAQLPRLIAHVTEHSQHAEPHSVGVTVGGRATPALESTGEKKNAPVVSSSFGTNQDREPPYAPPHDRSVPAVARPAQTSLVRPNEPAELPPPADVGLTPAATAVDLPKPAGRSDVYAPSQLAVHWNQILAQLPMDHSYLEKARPELLPNGELSLTFPADSKFTMETMSSDSVRMGRIVAMVRQVTGHNLPLVFHLATATGVAGAGDASIPAKTPQQIRREKLEHPLVEAVTKRFRASAGQLAPPPKTN